MVILQTCVSAPTVQSITGREIESACAHMRGTRARRDSRDPSESHIKGISSNLFSVSRVTRFVRRTSPKRSVPSGPGMLLAYLWIPIVKFGK